MADCEPRAWEAFDAAMTAVTGGHATVARDEFKDIRTEDLVRLHRYAHITSGAIEFILIERLGPSSAALLLAAKG